MRAQAKTLVATFLMVIGMASLGHAQKARWVETHSWSGVGAAQTPVFTVNGAKWRIRYRPVGTGVFAVALYDKSGDILDMAVEQNEPLRGTRRLKGRGDRYLSVACGDVRWSIVIEQYLTVVEEWDQTQIARRPKPELVKLGTWAGSDGEAQYELSVPRGSWKVVHENSGEGFLQITIEDSKGTTHLAANTSRKGQSESWVHQNGEFTMTVKAANTNWKVDVLAQE